MTFLYMLIVIHSRFGLVWLLEFYVPAIAKVISGWVPTYGSAYSWWLYSAVLLRDQATTSKMTWLISISVKQFLSYPNNAERHARKLQILFFKSLVWLDQGSNPSVQNTLISQNSRPKSPASTVCAHDSFIMLPHCGLRLMGPRPNFPLTHIILILS